MVPIFHYSNCERSELIDRVQSTDAEVVITKNGKPAAVLVSPDEFDRWKETLYEETYRIVKKESSFL